MTAEKTRADREIESLVALHDALASYIAVVAGSAAVVKVEMDTLENKAVFEGRVNKMNLAFRAMLSAVQVVANSMAPIVNLADFFDRNPDTMMAAAISAVAELPPPDESNLIAAKERLTKQFWYLRACTEGIKEGRA